MYTCNDKSIGRPREMAQTPACHPTRMLIQAAIWTADHAPRKSATEDDDYRRGHISRTADTSITERHGDAQTGDETKLQAFVKKTFVCRSTFCGETSMGSCMVFCLFMSMC